eukprot:CAMPEP_0170395432 /NCGR_PEP_ID=MMETSP0117_2-20130122/21774_2 /TAXON_ID=400756 /ORGANISM="Durinskia baltica, Strain CSIRO CS-38" /LENGTH=136 /DNA_ID=CAMNT_0010651739 /DNA_START=218 /DNA_END=625 /DNA_ORIENTATION=-
MTAGQTSERSATTAARRHTQGAPCVAQGAASGSGSGSAWGSGHATGIQPWLASRSKSLLGKSKHLCGTPSESSDVFVSFMSIMPLAGSQDDPKARPSATGAPPLAANAKSNTRNIATGCGCVPRCHCGELAHTRLE